MVIHGTTDNASTTSDKPAILVDSAGRIITTGQSGASASQVQGTAAGNAAASGNPVQVGGIYESTPSTYDNNDAVPLHTDSRGNARVVLSSPDSATLIQVGNDGADGQGTATNGLKVVGRATVFNGTTVS